MAEPLPSPAAQEVLLGLADDDLFVGHRHSEWLGYAPVLEEDLAFASIGQDELGHASLVYALLTGGDEKEADRLAFSRAPHEYRSAWLAERATPAWEDALVRHLLYDLAEERRWSALTSSTVAGLAPLASRVLLEERYHSLHARTLFVRLAEGTEESHARVQRSLDALAPLATGLFEPPLGEAEALAEGAVATAAGDLEAAFREAVADLVRPFGLRAPFAPPVAPGGRAGVRSGDFAEAHATMTAVLRLDPQAAW